MKFLAAIWRKLWRALFLKTTVTSRTLLQELRWHKSEGFVTVLMICSRCHVPQVCAVQPEGEKLLKRTGYECAKCGCMTAYIMAEIDVEDMGSMR